MKQLKLGIIMKYTFFLLILLYITYPGIAKADNDDIANQVIRSQEEFPKIEAMNWLNQKFLTRQRGIIEEIARSNFGRSLQGNQRDIAVLQRIVDANLIQPNETVKLQALGVILGDAYVSESKKLHWKIFTDDLGPTHAVCVDGTKQCIFALTMLSRRMEVGIKPNVSDVYTKGWDAIAPLLPKVPYSVKK